MTSRPTGVTILMAVGLCYALGLQNASRLGGVAATVITIVPRAGPAYRAALERCIEVTYCIGCALAFAALSDYVRPHSLSRAMLKAPGNRKADERRRLA